jgi:hypothetical protein
MKLLRQDGDQFEFRFARREQEVFRNVLEAFPVTPPEHHQLSRGQPRDAADPDQVLLRQSMASLTAEWRQRIATFLASEQRFRRDGHGYRLALNREEIEWLLCVLNDVRVGSWVRLGCPDPEEAPAATPSAPATPDHLRHLVLMEVAGHFQYSLLAAVDGTNGVGWGGRAA